MVLVPSLQRLRGPGGSGDENGQPSAHSRPQSRLVLLAAGGWARRPSEPPFPRAKAPPAKRDRRLWGRECHRQPLTFFGPRFAPLLGPVSADGRGQESQMSDGCHLNDKWELNCGVL